MLLTDRAKIQDLHLTQMKVMYWLIGFRDITECVDCFCTLISLWESRQLVPAIYDEGKALIHREGQSLC